MEEDKRMPIEALYYIAALCVLIVAVSFYYAFFAV
jgi:hypothetical protein